MIFLLIKIKYLLLFNDILRHKIAGGKLSSDVYNNGGMWLMSG